MSTRAVAVFTSSRADLGPLAPVMAAIDASAGLDLIVVATGSHADPGAPDLGSELGLHPGSRVVVFDAGIVGDSPAALVAALGRIAAGVSAVLGGHRVDLLMVLGDRWELMAVAATALLHEVPLVHLHGGEITEGALDERVRHAVTKLSDIHLCSTTDAAGRLEQLGEQPARIHVTGAPGLDRFRALRPMGLDQLSRALGVGIERPFGLVTYHPPTVDRTAVGARARAVFDASAASLASVVISHPGVDPGADQVREEIAGAAGRHANVHVVANLGALYPHAMARADVMVGNSSSGVIEAASFGLGVVDVGERQRGRTHGANVIHVGEDAEAVRCGIEAVLDNGFRPSLAGLVNPYGDGHASERIVSVLEQVDLADLGPKPFHHLAGRPVPRRGEGS